MRCHSCGGSYAEVHGPLVLRDKCVGEYRVGVEKYLRCDGCGDALLSVEVAEQADRERREKLTELLQSRPLAAFVTAAEAVAILGVSRQAFHKNRRIRKGLIHQTQLGGLAVYLRESVERYKETGDGRLPLYPNTEYLPPRSQGRIPSLDWRKRHAERQSSSGIAKWSRVSGAVVAKEAVYAR